MNVLVTGHSGFLGGHVVDTFVENGHTVYGASRALNPESKAIQYVIDIIDKNQLARVMNEKFVDTVIHCAAKPIVADCDKDPFGAIEANALGTAAVLEAARYANVKRIVLVETDKVYGFQEQVPTKEDAIPNPGSPYEFSKVLAASIAEFYRQHYGMDITSVRPVNLFGPRDYSYSRIVPAAMRAIKEGKGIPVQHEAMTIKRDFLYVKDAAKMLYILATQFSKHAAYNLSDNDTMLIPELADRITAALGHDVKPVKIRKPGDYPEIPFQSIDGTRFNEEFNFKFTSFEDAIRETYRCYNESRNNV